MQIIRLISKHFKFNNRTCKYFSTMETTSKIAVCQLTCTNDKSMNLNLFKSLVRQAVDSNAKMVFFPEATDYVAKNKMESIELAESLDGPTMKEYKNVAKENNIWISIGGFHEKCADDSECKLRNSHVIINNEGDIKAIYRKLHLFDVSIPEKNINMKESDYVVKGPEIVPPIETPAGPLGLSICYDLRFPELGTILRKMGAHILTYPSAFMTNTGKAHWKALLQARAIENQCYVIAAAQYGQHNEKRYSYGHSIVIDPWGSVIAECEPYTEGKESDCSIAIATIDSNLIQKVRSEMPVFEHRRNDLYNLVLSQTILSIDDIKYKFAHIDIPASTVFHCSTHCFAFTNIRCVVPGHVLISSRRAAKRLQDLTPEEISDFFNTAVKVQKVMESVHGSNSSTICVQDGIDAGQTIPQVHCHILPRKEHDFTRNDDIYTELAKHDRDDNPQPIRSVEEMTKEAGMLRKYFL